ncbi:hypothetical protein ABZ566_35865, partial [Streptomyces hygroscopicus]|uniref:hypothetical protein n=1 Tax=Streptomyces hygroscopicus TaxID=1912 RepID=UPI0033ED683C
EHFEDWDQAAWLAALARVFGRVFKRELDLDEALLCGLCRFRTSGQIPGQASIGGRLGARGPRVRV